ncbi:hypothetical protein AYI70_g3215 [Smittium culicis]|uniref:Mediator of RNA polymerase II transcription subunit 4 n=1 Tax=Smittium culicis TaxID=133412 RepID=A0A1R1Y4G8_9FUNG|nr:hypothetical protein AYI70_g3215 [Smittium culicis]
MDSENTPLISLFNKTINDYNETLRALLSSFDVIAPSSTNQSVASLQRKKLVENLIHIDKNLSILNDKIALHQQLQKLYQNLDEIIGHSKRISSFTSAPPNYDSNKPLLPAEPPYPIELVIFIYIYIYIYLYLYINISFLTNILTISYILFISQLAEEAQDTDIIGYIEQENNFDIDPSSFLLDLDLNPDLE